MSPEQIIVHAFHDELEKIAATARFLLYKRLKDSNPQLGSAFARKDSASFAADSAKSTASTFGRPKYPSEQVARAKLDAYKASRATGTSALSKLTELGMKGRNKASNVLRTLRRKKLGF